MNSEPEKTLYPNSNPMMDDASSNTARPSHNASLTNLNHSPVTVPNGAVATEPAPVLDISEKPTVNANETPEEIERDALEKHADPQVEDESQYPTGFKLFLICLALCLAVFLVALV